NSFGNVVDPATGLPWTNFLAADLDLSPPPPAQVAAFAALVADAAAREALNTTVAVVTTDAALSPAACRRVAVAAHDGLARAIRPSHPPLDGDTVFAVATGAIEVPASGKLPASMSRETELTAVVGAAAADCLARAVLVAVTTASAAAGIPTYRDVLPGSLP